MSDPVGIFNQINGIYQTNFTTLLVVMGVLLTVFGAVLPIASQIMQRQNFQGHGDNGKEGTYRTKCNWN